MRPSGDAVYAITQMLRKINPSGNAGEQVQRAEALARIDPQLDRSSERAFHLDAKNKGLTKQEAVALWDNR